MFIKYIHIYFFTKALPKYMRLLQNAPKGTPVPPYMMMMLPESVTELDANS